MKIYAAYGSNMNLEQMSERCKNAKVYTTGVLENYTLKFSGAGHANVEKEENKQVPIVLWQITEDCEKSLDIYETYPEYYIKETVEIKTDDGYEKALIYIMTDEKGSIRKNPQDEYYNTIYQGYIDNGLDVEILSKFKEDN